MLNICIREEFRRRGIGRGLLNALLVHARDRGVRDAFLEVRRTNRGAIALYHELGFECVGTRRGYYQAQDGREDALVYRLELGSASIKGTVTFTREAIVASNTCQLVKATVPFIASAPCAMPR